MEAIRLRAPGMITRKLTDDFKIKVYNTIFLIGLNWRSIYIYTYSKGYSIPAGSLLMLSPYWTHRNPAYFHNPNQFNPV